MLFWCKHYCRRVKNKTFNWVVDKILWFTLWFLIRQTIQLFPNISAGNDALEVRISEIIRIIIRKWILPKNLVNHNFLWLTGWKWHIYFKCQPHILVQFNSDYDSKIKVLTLARNNFKGSLGHFHGYEQVFVVPSWVKSWT